jgi:uncharacterized membrane protein YfcA
MPVADWILPQGLTPILAAALVAASFLTSGFTAAFGIGGGVSLLALMGFILPVGALVPVHGVVQFGSNFGRAAIQSPHIRWFPLTAFALGAIIGAAIGVNFVITLDDALLKVLLGLFILVITWVSVPRLKEAGSMTFITGGLLTGIATMFVGATGPFVIALYEKTFSERRQVIATHAAAMVCQHGMKILAFGMAGFAFRQWLALIIAMVVSGLAGTFLGSKLLDQMPETDFRVAFKWLMTALALLLVARGLFLIQGH